jgi:hypothetical protein
LLLSKTQFQTKEAIQHALDNLYLADDSLAAWNGVVIHARWIHSHSADPGSRHSLDPNYSRTESGLGDDETQKEMAAYHQQRIKPGLRRAGHCGVLSRPPY